jgi:hypothetical protein
MKNIIHHIRKQPEEVRMHILHILTATFAVILVLLWIYSLGANLSSPSTEAGIGQDIKPFSALKDNMVNGYDSMSQPSTSTDSSGSTDPNADLRAQENSL